MYDFRGKTYLTNTRPRNTADIFSLIFRVTHKALIMHIRGELIAGIYC